jgi:uncharacterized protein GlcG (DUF336 family)
VNVSLEQAQAIVNAALTHARAQGYKPLTVAVLDTGGALVALGRDDGSGFLRPDVAVAKAYGVIGLNMDSRAIAQRAADAPSFHVSLAALTGGKAFPVPGGVFITDDAGTVHRSRVSRARCPGYAPHPALSEGPLRSCRRARGALGQAARPRRTQLGQARSRGVTTIDSPVTPGGHRASYRLACILCLCPTSARPTRPTVT